MLLWSCNTVCLSSGRSSQSANTRIVVIIVWIIIINIIIIITCISTVIFVIIHKLLCEHRRLTSF